MHKKRMMLWVAGAALVLLVVFAAVMLLSRGNAQQSNKSTTSAGDPTTTGHTLATDVEIWTDENLNTQDTVAPAADTEATGGGDKEHTTTTETQPEAVSDETTSATTGTATEATTPTVNNQAKELTYGEYISLSGEEQLAYVQSFASPADYFAWYNKAKEAYDNKEVHEIDGNINLGDFIP